jgi:hypothetical protein
MVEQIRRRDAPAQVCGQSGDFGIHEANAGYI